MSDQIIQLTLAQLQAVVAQAVESAIAANKPVPRTKAAKVEDPAKAERAEKYLASKKATAMMLAKKSGRQYYVCRKGRKLLVWSEDTRANASRKGVNPNESLGTPVWSTYEGGYRQYMA